MPHKQLIVLDMIDSRLELAKQIGADVVLNPGKEDALAECMRLTGQIGCDVYIEATGHPSAVQQGLDMLRKGGSFVEFSVMSGTSTIDWSIIGDAKELTIRGSQLSPYCYPKVIQAIQDKKLKIDKIVSHKFRLEDWEEAYRVAQTREALKVVFVF